MTGLRPTGLVEPRRPEEKQPRSVGSCNVEAFVPVQVLDVLVPQTMGEVFAVPEAQQHTAETIVDSLAVPFLEQEIVEETPAVPQLRLRGDGSPELVPRERAKQRTADQPPSVPGVPIGDGGYVDLVPRARARPVAWLDT